mmetsp:Transcript_14059/g.24937  ORF Transcript_14059/g.24937 Transcript_14059/m.24937 type:complete len:683 (+) Transcript_14059:343-2391(+)
MNLSARLFRKSKSSPRRRQRNLSGGNDETDDVDDILATKKRLEWLENERVRLLQLSHASSRTLSATSLDSTNDDSGSPKGTTKRFTVTVTLGKLRDKENSGQNTSMDFTLSIGLALEEHVSGLVVNRFIRDTDGNPGSIESSGHVSIGDTLISVEGDKTEKLNHAQRVFEQYLKKGATELSLEFSRKISRQASFNNMSTVKELQEHISYLENELKFARDEYARLDIGALESLQFALDDSRAKVSELETKINELNAVQSTGIADIELVHRYEVKEKECRRLYNTLIDLKGAIRVFVRVRPPTPTANLTKSCVLHFPEPRQVVVSDLTNYDVPEKHWSFDSVFPPQATQEQVYSEVEPIIKGVIDGHNACVFAYGQTGSGKTYTMEGVTDDHGIYDRAVVSLFNEIANRKEEASVMDETASFTVQASVLEIYHERVQDLLRVSPISTSSEEGDGQHVKEDVVIPSQSLEIMHNPKTGYVYVQGANEVTVSTASELHQVIEQGKQNRIVGVTIMNERSSRSHLVVIISITCKTSDAKTGVARKTIRSKLQMIDLAGSERISKSGLKSSKDTGSINKSLAALGDVLHALQNEDSRHIPFRNSKLTSLLRDSLGGKAKTLMMIQVSPLRRDIKETSRSLDFAQRVGKICFGGSSVSFFCARVVLDSSNGVLVRMMLLWVTRTLKQCE